MASRSGHHRAWLRVQRKACSAEADATIGLVVAAPLRCCLTELKSARGRNAHLSRASDLQLASVA
jgi:hypothetical protein